MSHNFDSLTTRTTRRSTAPKSNSGHLAYSKSKISKVKQCFQSDHDVLMQLCKDEQKFPADSLAVRLCNNGDLSFSVRS